MKPIDIVIIVAAILIVAAVLVVSLIRKAQGRSSACSECCRSSNEAFYGGCNGNCAGCASCPSKAPKPNEEKDGGED